MAELSTVDFRCLFLCKECTVIRTVDIFTCIGMLEIPCSCPYSSNEQQNKNHNRFELMQFWLILFILSSWLQLQIIPVIQISPWESFTKSGFFALCIFHSKIDFDRSTKQESHEVNWSDAVKEDRNCFFVFISVLWFGQIDTLLNVWSRHDLDLYSLVFLELQILTASHDVQLSNHSPLTPFFVLHLKLLDLYPPSN
jgi:hypothetical protein